MSSPADGGYVRFGYWREGYAVNDPIGVTDGSISVSGFVPQFIGLVVYPACAVVAEKPQLPVIAESPVTPACGVISLISLFHAVNTSIWIPTGQSSASWAGVQASGTAWTAITEATVSWSSAAINSSLWTKIPRAGGSWS